MAQGKTLLDRAKSVPKKRVKKYDDRLREEAELAVAYASQEVTGKQVAAAAGLKNDGAAHQWSAYTIMKGVRSGLLRLTWAD